jgi:predicted metal-dependent peptidase
MEVNLDNNMLKAKIELMTKSVFISTICLSVRHIITDSVPTAATNNTTIFYNPKFISGLSVAELAGLIAHECWHIAYLHLLRRGDRDPTIWNYAGDYKINYMLIKAGFELPPGGLYDEKYDDEWSTDSVYDELKENDTDIDADNMILDILGDAPDDGSDMSPEDINGAVKDILVRAHTQTKMSGNEAGEIPEEILRVIDGLLNPKVPWDTVLNRFIDRRVKEAYSWARKSRRYQIYLPSLYSYGLSHLTWAIDTSGSQDDGDLQNVLTQIDSVQKMMRPERMTIIDCDSRIHNIYEINATTDILSLKFTGGGGTSFIPVLNYVSENPTQALVYFTDLYGETNLSEVDYPVLWICNSTHPPANIGETVYIDP